MLEEVFDYLKNDFRVKRIDGDFHVTNGLLMMPGDVRPLPGQCIRIFGSTFNDGVHIWDDDSLTNESWNGTVWLLAPPTELIQLVGKIAQDVEASRQAQLSSVGPLKSESFDGYSYTRATRADGTLMDWRDVYRDQLARWRKL